MKRTQWVWMAAGVLAAMVMWQAPARAEDGDQAQKVEPAKERGFLEWDPAFCEKLDKFIQSTKQPCPQFSWGADLRLRTIWSDNLTTLNDDVPNHTRHFQRYRSRVWAKVSPHEDVDFNVRLVWEPRVIQKGPRPNGPVNSRYIWDEALFDKLNVVWRNIAGLPLTVKAGRQDIIFGNGWLFLEGTPLDGSRTIFFDAIRATYQAEKIDTTFDVIYLQNDDDEDQWIKPFNQTGQTVIESDERGVIFYVTNKSLETTSIEGYYAYKHDTPRSATGKDQDIHTIGGRVFGKPTDNVEYRAEGAMQWGERMGHYLRGFGFNSQAAYLFHDGVESRVHADYEFLSGDDPNTSTVESFDPLWGRWPQWSELYIYTIAMENRRPAEVTNLHRLAFGYDCKPASNLAFRANYHLLWADENTYAGGANFSGDNHFRGQLLEAKLNYKFCEHVAGHVVTEFFFPGEYYSDRANDPAMFLRYELVFTW